jgi:hypothetical protein
MLTRKKKQNLLYLGIGVLIGFVIASGVTYFSVIKQFTKSNINKIQSVFPTAEKDTVTKSITKPIIKTTDTTNDNIELEITETLVIDTTDTNGLVSLLNEDIIIKTDTKIDASVLPIYYVDSDTSMQTEKLFKEIMVEQWENPTNFAGYRKDANTLIIYGISIYEIELQYINNNIYLIYNNNKIEIKESETFIRFPSSFIAR